MAFLTVSNRQPDASGTVLRGRYLATVDIAEGPAWAQIVNVLDPAGVSVTLASLIGRDGVDVEIKAGAAALRVAIVAAGIDLGSPPAANQHGMQLDPGEAVTRMMAAGDALWIRS